MGACSICSNFTAVPSEHALLFNRFVYIRAYVRHIVGRLYIYVLPMDS